MCVKSEDKSKWVKLSNSFTWRKLNRKRKKKDFYALSLSERCMALLNVWFFFPLPHNLCSFLEEQDSCCPDGFFSYYLLKLVWYYTPSMKERHFMANKTPVGLFFFKTCWYQRKSIAFPSMGETTCITAHQKVCPVYPLCPNRSFNWS